MRISIILRQALVLSKTLKSYAFTTIMDDIILTLILDARTRKGLFHEVKIKAPKAEGEKTMVE